METAKVILEQLGGRQFIAMTGARDLIGSADALMFRIGRGAKDGANKVRITLDRGLDLYVVEVFKIRGADVRTLERRDAVHVAALRATFTALTGMEVAL